MNTFFTTITKKQIRGFTLVEILVVLGVFSSVMVIAAGALLTTQSINTKLKESQSVLDNVNLSVELMARDIRYGSEFHCGVSTFTGATLNPTASSTLRKNCSFVRQGGTMLIFKPYNAATSTDRVAYYLDSGSILYKDEYTDEGNATTTYQVTTDNVTIKSLVFYVSGANTSAGVGRDVFNAHDYEQPIVSFTIFGETEPSSGYFKVIAGEGTEAVNIKAVKFIVQDSVTSRILDI